MKLLIVIHSLDLGGTQRFATNLSRGLVERGFDVAIATLSHAAEPDFFPLPGVVRRHRLEFDRPHSGSVWSKVKRDFGSVRDLRAVVRSTEPDVVLSLGTSTNVITLMTMRGLRVPVVISERADPRATPTGRGWAVGRRLLYPLATHTVTQTEGVAQFMRRWVRRGRITTIGNPVPAHLFEIERDPSTVPHVVTVCRLASQKGVDVLLRAFAVVVAHRSDATLSVVGDGPDRHELERQAVALGIDEAVTFHGMLDDPTTVSHRAWCGCLASRNEGFPNALIEMMSIGLPCVSTDCPSGPAELLGSNVGVLVPVDDEKALAAALVCVLGDSDLRLRLGAAARDRAMDFIEGRVVDRWHQLLQDQAGAPT